MFIHIGSEHTIQAEDIITMIDYETVDSSQMMKKMMQHKKKAIIGSKETAKAIIFTNDSIYFSPLSVYTLKKRANIDSLVSNLDDYTDEDNLD